MVHPSAAGAPKKPQRMRVFLLRAPRVWNHRSFFLLFFCLALGGGGKKIIKGKGAGGQEENHKVKVSVAKTFLVEPSQLFNFNFMLSHVGQVKHAPREARGPEGQQLIVDEQLPPRCGRALATATARAPPGDGLELLQLIP